MLPAPELHLPGGGLDRPPRWFFLGFHGLGGTTALGAHDRVGGRLDLVVIAYVPLHGPAKHVAGDLGRPSLALVPRDQVVLLLGVEHPADGLPGTLHELGLDGLTLFLGNASKHG